MSPSDDTPLADRLARWSEWWFTPRWRALLTWLALTGITAALQEGNLTRFYDITQRPIAYLNSLLPAPLPPIFNSIAYSVTVWLLFVWFQPLALRLSFRRGLAWISLPLVAEMLWRFLYSLPGYPSKCTHYAILVGSAALQCWAVWGWRSRPWMCLPAQALTSALEIFERLRYLDPPFWLNVWVCELPYAVLLLYGTRLLRPDERPRGTSVQ